jgi:hypothetical protein
MKERKDILSLLKNKDSGIKMSKQVVQPGKVISLPHPLDKSMTFNQGRYHFRKVTNYLGVTITKEHSIEFSQDTLKAKPKAGLVMGSNYSPSTLISR